MPIYTRTGDKGQTSLFDGTRVSKAHPRVNTYGTIDELNSILGAARAQLKALNSKGTIVTKELEKIQHDLLDIGSALAMPHPLPIIGLENRAKVFEQLIDVMTAKLPELKAFILPGGSKAGSFLHIARTVVRRAERQLVELMVKEPVDQAIVIYLNRLSDLLFTMARYVNHLEKAPEIKWIKK
ncbi:MAG TPA: cob(I)yrinic acid a,c-diamide adenosyltransferase [Patescibacteria group bacterium]